jgi:hypothetical protein
MVERNNGFLETSFLPGRCFASPADFNDQITTWLVKADTRTVRSIQGRPADLLEADHRQMLPLPPVAPVVGLGNRIRPGRDYCVRVDANDYSVDPKVIGRFVDVTASLQVVTVSCDGQSVAHHPRSRAKAEVITDPLHTAGAAQRRSAWGSKPRTPGTRSCSTPPATGSPASPPPTRPAGSTRSSRRSAATG